MKTDGKVEPVLMLLTACVVFFTIALFVSESFFYKDSQLFQVIAGLTTGFAGAVLARVKVGGSDDPTSTSTTLIARPAAGGGISTETTHTETPVVTPPPAADK